LRAALEQAGQMHAVALAAESTPTFFCWSAPVKPNCAQ
jgi:hypothetical protein